ncbi:NADH-quinone oxidoreductase, subunit G [gamma proteobacterium HdN1]|nr:NADH-quinone oxidoreductase, subunit G [gamma proteobacterium HdN1]
MTTIHVDDEAHEVTGDKNLLQACLELGLDLPYFCWHPAMGSVGSCRQCAVKAFQSPEDTRGRIVMACMTPITDGMRVSIRDEAAQTFRDQCIEALMTNHPHDCPVCEEGGECHLQDMTNLSQHLQREYRGRKRTFRNQYLGPFLNHEMNRCITCYRCLRFYRDYAGGRDLHALSSRNQVYFGRHEPGILENEFSGNLSEVCPTGVFTDKTFSAHFTRKWDLQNTASVCVHCAHGCNTSPGERAGILRRVVNRYNSSVNGYFLCDRGRFGYDFVNSDQRIRGPLLSGAPVVTVQGEPDFVERLASSLRNVPVIGIGSPRASLEANFALMDWVGRKNFYAGVGRSDLRMLQCVVEILRQNLATTPTLREVEQADAVLIIGEDVLHTAPRLALAIRQANRNKAIEQAKAARIHTWDAVAVQNHGRYVRSPLMILSTHVTGLDELASRTHVDVAANLARVTFAVAHRLDASAPAVQELSDDEMALVDDIAAMLTTAKHPLIVAGTQCASLSLIQAAANVASATALNNLTARFMCVVPECNSIGMAMLGEAAHGESRHGESTQGEAKRSNGGHALEDAISSVINAAPDAKKVVVILENDLYRRMDPAIVDAFLKNARQVIALDHLHNATTAKAEVVLPAATFAEAHGTLVSNEGRAQRQFSCFQPTGSVRPSWQWISRLDEKHGSRHFDQLTRACADSVEGLAAIVDAAPSSEFRMAGVKIARQTHRYSGRTALRSHINVSEPRQETDPESALAYSMEGLHDGMPSSLRPDYWAPSWNSNEAINKFQNEMAGELTEGDPGVRLFEPLQNSIVSQWYTQIPERWQASAESFQPYPVAMIFGSEELSVAAPAVRERVGRAAVILHAQDAERMNLEEGDSVVVRSGDWAATVGVTIDSRSARGSIGIPLGHPDFHFPSGDCLQQDVTVEAVKNAATSSFNGQGEA